MSRKILILLILPMLVLGLSLTAGAEPLPEFELMTTTEGYDPIRYEAAFLIEENFAELGIQVDVQPTEFSTLIDNFYNEQDFDVAIVGWSGRVERLDPQHFLGTLHSGQTDPGGNNPGGYANERVDELFAQQEVEFDMERRQEMVYEIQEISVSEQPVNVLFYRDEVLAFNRNKFEGFQPMAGEGIYTEWLPFDVTPLTDDRMVTIGTSQEPDNINPLDSTTVWGWKFMRLYYDKLVRLTPDVEPEPWAAESFEAIDEDTIEVVLREGMYFHDGEPVTVEDVKFSYDYYMDQDFAYFRPFYQPLDYVEIVDDSTLHFHLEVPVSNFITVTMSQIPILPEHLWADIEVAQDLAPDEIPTVGSGPMKFETFDSGEYKSLSTFEDHFAADDIDIDGIDYIIYADAEGVFTGLITEEVDMNAWRLEPGHIEPAEAEDHLEVVSVPDHGYYHMTYNLRIEPFDDVNFRRAIAHAIPKDTFVDVLLDGLGEPGTSVISPANPFWHNPDVERFEYDLDRARELLEEAGYYIEDGVLHFPEN